MIIGCFFICNFKVDFVVFSYSIACDWCIMRCHISLVSVMRTHDAIVEVKHDNDKDESILDNLAIGMGGWDQVHKMEKEFPKQNPTSPPFLLTPPPASSSSGLRGYPGGPGPAGKISKIMYTCLVPCAHYFEKTIPRESSTVT